MNKQKSWDNLWQDILESCILSWLYMFVLLLQVDFIGVSINKVQVELTLDILVQHHGNILNFVASCNQIKSTIYMILKSTKND